jgi:uncharacterized membrane protein YGL010W
MILSYVSPIAHPVYEKRRSGAMDNFQGLFLSTFSLMTLILMGDWCS